MNKLIKAIPHLPPRQTDTHKGHYGKILIIGGCREMIGAPSLTANAALRSGAGLVRVALPKSIQLTVAGLVPCATTIPLNEDENGILNRYAAKEILTQLPHHDCVAIGPGLNQSNDLQTIVKNTVTECKRPMVIDADGLNNLAPLGDGIFQHLTNAVLTPHPGELKRLWKAWFREDLPNDRIEQAQTLTQRCGAVVVLKGAGTVVAHGNHTYINESGNPGMATGGSGDVLTGCLAALLGRNLPDQPLTNFDAAILATYIHGRAGDLAADALTQTALIASDLIDFLPQAWAALEE